MLDIANLLELGCGFAVQQIPLTLKASDFFGL
jgi:hypothetical protein